MEMFLKRSCKLKLKFYVYFRNILKLSITFNYKKSINSVADMVAYTPQFKHKNNQKALTHFSERCWMLYVPI